jgi:hypothetical protein
MAKLLIFTTAALLLCFAQDQGKPSIVDEGYERYLKKFADAYGISELKRPYKADGQQEISDLQPLLSWLTNKKITQISSDEKQGSVRRFTIPFMIIIREDADTQTFYSGEIHVYLGKSFDDAERFAASYLSNISVPLDKRSFSGTIVGDWTASRYEHDRKAVLFFLKKNAFVRISYQSPIEIYKAEKTRPRRQDPDPSIKERCEALAREIDEQLAMLPGSDAK